VDEVLVALADQQAELASYVATATGADLARASRCEGWSVADVLTHLAQTNELAVASIEGSFDQAAAALAEGTVDMGSTVDDWAAAVVAAHIGDPEAARDRWQASAVEQLAAFEAADPHHRVQWVAGTMAVRTLASTRLTECWIHTVDIAVAFGPAPAPTDRLRHTCRLVWRTLPYALARAGRDPAGTVAFELDAPDGDTWSFGEQEADTIVRGSAAALCEVAGQRALAATTDLRAHGPDGEAVLATMRTFA
jgi:uncharacterized protein (TIGR03084 family)